MDVHDDAVRELRVAAAHDAVQDEGSKWIGARRHGRLHIGAYGEPPGAVLSVTAGFERSNCSCWLLDLGM